MPSLACPPPALIRDLACGRVPADREAELDSHLSACTSCAAIHDEHLRPFVAAVRDLSTSNAPDTPPLPPGHIERLKQNYHALRTVVRLADPSVGEAGAATITVSAPNRLGKFLLLAELGRGGMGCVYKARDEILNRDVALKVILLQRGRRAVTDTQRQNLFTEAQAAAKLNHPNIVPVYEAGEADDQPYLAMPLLDGETLAARLKRGRIPLAVACRIGAQVAEGLAAAHDTGLLHRDIKPANLWLERLKTKSERVVILDFGLARPVADATGVAGTPAYMAPEQAAGQPLTDRADLFSLGVVLFEMLSGKKLFSGAQRTVTDLLASVSAFDAPVPAKLLPGVPTRLAALVAGLLRNDPARRVPGTAHKLAAKLAALAVELAPGYARRRWFLVARTAALVVAGGLVVAGAFQLKRTQIDAPVNLVRAPQPKVVNPEPEPAPKVEPKVGPNGLLVPVPSAENTIPLALAENKSAKNLDLLNRDEITRVAAVAAGDGDPLRVAPEIVAVIDAARKPGDDGHTDFVETVALHPNGAILASGGTDTVVRLWDLSGAAPKLLTTLKNHKKPVTALAFTPDGKWLVGAAHNILIAWPFGSDAPAKEYDLTDAIAGLGVSRTGNLVAVGHGGENVRVLELDTEKLRPVIRGNRKATSGLAFSPDNTRLVLGSMAMLRVIDLDGKKEPSEWPEAKVWFSAVAVNANGTRFLANGVGTVVGSRAGWGRLLPGFGNNHDLDSQHALSVRELSTPWATRAVLKHEGRVHQAEFVRDDKYVIALTDDCRVHLWAWAAEARLASVALGYGDVAHRRECRAMAVHPDGRHAIVCRTNGQIYVVRFNHNP